MRSVVRQDGERWTVDETHADYPRKPNPLAKGAAERPSSASGPGTELKTLLRDWLGIVATPTCSCNVMARRMDALGPDWCEGDGMAEILGVMRVEHAKRWQAGQTRLPWTDIGARQLVRLACRRARAKESKQVKGDGKQA